MKQIQFPNALKANIVRLVGANGGAAGTLLVRRANPHEPNSPPTHVVLHQRTSGHWALPGGVIDAGETPREAAFRESFEEASLPRNCREGDDPLVIVTDEVVTYDHGTWKYTVVICNVTKAWVPQKRRGDYETLAVEWVPVEQVAGYNLHGDFKTQWPALLEALQAIKSVGVGPCSVVPEVKQEMSTDNDNLSHDTSNGTNIERPVEQGRRPSGHVSLSSADLLVRRYQSNLRVRTNISAIKASARREGSRI